jgi:FkbM family methyltransferase
LGLDEFLQNTLVNLTDYRDNARLFGLTDEFRFIDFCLNNLHFSRAQLLQDLFVLFRSGGRPGGFFVEFGATNGVDLSNTYQLEKRFQWTGILAEPATCWHEALMRNRGCAVDTRCVWDRTGDYLEFNEVSLPEYSTINTFSAGDGHAEKRQAGDLYQVETISLNELLAAYAAPRVIDYLSIDTEGSELSILSAFDFDRYDVRTMTVEHNYTPDRERIHALLVSKGFVRMFEKFSRWDDWYVKP